MKKGRSGSEASGSQKLRDVLTNPISVNTTNSMDKKLDHVENVPLSSIESMQEMKTYIKTLNEYKHKMEAMVDGIIKSVDAPRERSQDNDNIIIRKIPSATKGNPSSIMKCGIPLIVEPPLIHDVSHVVNDTFRDYLCHQLPGNKRKLFDSLELKEHLSLIEEIRRAEKDVMEVQERFLIADNKGDQIIELSKWTVEKYSLLCPARMFVNNANEEKENALNEQVVGEKYGIHGELRRLRMHLNKERPKLNVKYCVPGLLSNRELWTVEKPKEPVCLSVNTDFVHFNRFVSGRIYKKNAIITNTGKRLTPFYITVHGNGGSFEYDYTPRRPLAAGMSAKLTVTFKCTSMEDIYELLTITTRDDQKIGIIVFAENEKMPILKYITERYDCEKDFPKPNHRQSNCVFDCNACLLGAAKTISVTVTNIGRSSKFVCVPEDVWYTKSVKDVEWKQTMSLDGFKITPSMFEIKCGRSLALSVMFEPRSSMFYCSRFIIMSDNACAHQVNVFGDGETYDAGGVTFEGRGLQQWSADEAASYVLEMGRIGEVVRYVYAKNSSRIKYPYRWIINHDGIVDPGPTDRATVNFNIHPSSGTLDKLSRTAFRVECGVAANDDGTTTVDDRLAGKTYRVTATMMIDDIPKSSLNSQDVVFEVQESSSELLSIQVAQIQAISEFKGKERISLRVEPVILDLNWYRLRVDSCIEETVDFVNGSPCPALVTWVPGGGSVVRVEPERFEVTDRTTVRVSVKPQCAGRMHETLRFRAENRDGVVAETEMYVRGTVERKPELCVRSPALAQLGAVYVGRPVSYPVDLMLANTGTDAKPFHVYKQMYDFEGDCSGSWNLRSRDAVCYGPYSTGSDVAGGADGPATLRLETPVNTEVTAVGLSCQLAEWSLAESTEPAAVAFTQSVTYAVLPDVRLNVNAVTVAECLYKSVSHSHREIRLVNNTPYELVYSWGNPMGSDADNVDCTFKPANGTVDGDAFVEFEFIVTPKTSGHFDECYIPCFVQCEAVPPQQFCFRWRAEGFSATIVYADECSGQYTVTWVDDKNQWIVDRESSIDIDEAEGNYSENEDNLTSITNTWSNSGDMENLQEDDIE